MKPGPFTYHVPAAMMDALAVLAGHEITRALGDGLYVDGRIAIGAITRQ